MTRQRYSNREALEVKVDYVESKLDDTINNFKEAIVSLKKSIEKSEARLEADRQATEARLRADREESAARLAADRDEFNKRFAEERKEWHSHKRWMYLNFGGLIALIVTVVLALMNGSIPN